MTTTPEAYVHLSEYSEYQKTLTFYYDTLRANRYGTKWGIRDTRDDYGNPAWTANSASPDTTILTAVFDASFRDFRPTTTAGWFAYLRSLKSIEGFEHLNTSQVTDMSGMFLGCSSLTEIDLSHFDTSQVTNMNGMFMECSSLTALD
ncbi:MAG: BspA family leucine-rich repeat surface protein, partial [Prevotellaceae bacterium]|nr:BspA family leucine-rich repeat surface protein [Prevotellaceae bacterium]